MDGSDNRYYSRSERRSGSRDWVNGPDFGRYLGPELKGKIVSITIESKYFEFLESNSTILISESKNGTIRHLSLSRPSAIWLLESLSHPNTAREGWAISRFEGSFFTKSHWDANKNGAFVKISEGSDMKKSQICIPVGFKVAGIKLFLMGLKECLELKGENEVGVLSNDTREEHPGGLVASSLVDKDFKEPIMEGVGTELSRYSISSNLLDQDIARSQRVTSYVDMGSSNATQDTAEMLEEEKAQRLFQPGFDWYFESIFRTVVNQIQEALAQKMLLDKLKGGLIQNMSGKAIRATRETTKSMETVKLVQIEGTKHPVFISFSRIDEHRVMDFLTGEQAEDIATSG